MTEREIRTLRDKIGTDPILTDEEIEYIWMAMDQQEEVSPEDRDISETPFLDGCPSCSENLFLWMKYCPGCGKKIKWNR